jgi:hypothetical protein
MSDYWPELNLLGLPLFSAAKAATKEARTFNERDEAQANVLQALRGNARITKKTWEDGAANGSRLAPVIEQLRNAHGFAISGDGSIRKPYCMDDVCQCPALARVTPEMKVTYYQLPHWLKVKSERSAMDDHQCVLCRSSDDLRCHHVCYEKLFYEPLVDLLTLCDGCHDRVHRHCGLKLPAAEFEVKYAQLARAVERRLRNRSSCRNKLVY